jgi:hypothetical protein
MVSTSSSNGRHLDADHVAHFSESASCPWAHFTHSSSLAVQSEAETKIQGGGSFAHIQSEPEHFAGRAWRDVWSVKCPAACEEGRIADSVVFGYSYRRGAQES